MTLDELFAEFEAGFLDRTYLAGLLVTFVDFLLELEVPDKKLRNFEEFARRFPIQKKTAGGKRANTLIVARPNGKTLSLRPFYNQAETLFRSTYKRFDYPSCAAHATQAWADYEGWLDALVTFKKPELLKLRERVIDFVLANLKSQEFDPLAVRTEPPLFRLLLENFSITRQKGEPTGAPFQGLVFGFLRADNPHLQVEIDKVRTGSKRLQRVGDIDCWEGGRLAISAEVKQFTFDAKNVTDLAAFANQVGKRGALGLLVAVDFRSDSVREEVEALGVKALGRSDLLRIVELWDPLKQRTAVQSMIYYAQHVEKNSNLTARLLKFIEDVQTAGGASSAESVAES